MLEYKNFWSGHGLESAAHDNVSGTAFIPIIGTILNRIIICTCQGTNLKWRRPAIGGFPWNYAARRCSDIAVTSKPCLGSDHLIAAINLRSSLVILSLFAAGCASNVTVDEPTIPRPHIDKLPMDVALRIPEEFNNFVHEENVLGRETWTINLGRANASFFEQLFGYMFENVIILGPDDNALDFSVPNQSKTDAFAVWIRYRMQIYDSVGNNASTWTVSAYGKSQKEGLGGTKSLQRAAVLAMRDAAALILLQMNKSTKISALADGPMDVSNLESPTVADTDAPEFKASPAGIFAIGGIDDARE